jgi:hypothetical protein
VADRVIPPRERERVERSLIGQLGAQPLPQLIVEVGAAMECIRDLDQPAVFRLRSTGPTDVMGDRRELIAAETDSLGEERNVNAPTRTRSTRGTRQQRRSS